MTVLERGARCRCEYDLAGRSVGERCPECGAMIAPSRFRGAWIDSWARRRFLLGTSVLIGISAVDTLKAGLNLWALIVDVDANRLLGWVSHATPPSLLLALVVLATAARRIAVLWLLVTFVAARAVCEAVMWYAAPVFGWLMEYEVYRCFVIAWATAVVSVAVLPLVIARSSGQPQRRVTMWCCCLIGALGSAYYGLTAVDTDITLPIRELISWIAPGVRMSSVLLSLVFVGAGTTIGYLLLSRGIRRAE